MGRHRRGNVTTCRVNPGYYSLGHARHVEFRSCHARHETMAGITPQCTQGMKTWMLHARHVKVGFHALCCSLGFLVLSQTGKSYVCYNCTSAYWSVPQTTSYGERLQDITCVGVLWRTRYITIVATLIQWDANKWRGILQYSEMVKFSEIL